LDAKILRHLNNSAFSEITLTRKQGINIAAAMSREQDENVNHQR
jgi:hypothetical protein